MNSINANITFSEIGLLIEPNKSTFKKLINKNRNALHINSCLATDRKPQKVSFLNPEMDQLGGIVGNSISKIICDFDNNINKCCLVQISESAYRNGLHRSNLIYHYLIYNSHFISLH